ncbi:class I SAM-dependent rRNA methyltransferase [Streptococcus caviae]|uniref:class I SAM-dependent rRNA methyltransferase n=1 Tax=Streptococcus sp. 'caviae' TaxID=1915004 RepID=UPI00094B8D56|nr:class I SAM-dependent rRNA methyltransferase [Streptococcus sp. 'caviae']OLN82843.1 SAM-dependent methyltransferase [Streptococcus sp. 'caviae']
MNRLTVGSSAEKKIKRGIQLLSSKDFPNIRLTDQTVYLYSQAGSFLGTAYLSKQNKGVGWLVSSQKVTLNQAYFAELFQKAKEKREALANSDLTTAYRLFNQDGDCFGGMTVDRYGQFALFSWYNAFVYQLRDQITAAFRQVYPEFLGAYEKIRFKGPAYESAHLYGEKAPEHFTVTENGVSYSVFLNDGLMTGIFLDQRQVRNSLVNGLAAGKRVLNLFSYTAAFSVAAAMGGALETVSVDLAKRSKELSLAHFQANHLDMAQHQLVIMDVFAYLKYAKRHQLTFDVLIIDPPSFARNKKETFSVSKDYHKLISQGLEILAEDGLLIASANASNMTVAQFKKQLEKGFGKRQHTYLDLQQLPGDFAVNEKDESSNYLKVFTIKV